MKNRVKSERWRERGENGTERKFYEEGKIEQKGESQRSGKRSKREG